MRVRGVFIAAALLVAALAIPQAPPSPDQAVIRISVTLVQVDAVVTDSKGRPVSGLKAGDFELLQDGKPRKITHFSYVTTGAAPAPARPATVPDKTAPPPPPPVLRPSQVKRTIALVVDDLGLLFESMANVRDALKKFVAEQMQPGDLAAVVRTGAGMGAFQGFSADKRLLNAAIDRVKWNPLGRGGVAAFAPIGSDPQIEAEGDEEGGGLAREAEEFRENYFAVGTLGAINYIVGGLRELPGRKSVVLFSDNIRIFNRDRSTDRVLDAIDRLTDLANRASVVIYTIDPRGLPTLGLSAADRLGNMRPDRLAARLEQRCQEHFDSQEGLSYLAQQTGGLFIHDTNDVSGGLRRVLEDQSGYYLLGYNPGDATFNKQFHKIKVRVKRPGLEVRSRSGFIGVADAQTRPLPRTRDEQLFAALGSPFGSTGVALRLTSLFANNAKLGSFVYSLLHIDGRSLSFTDDAEGWKKTVLDVLVITFGDKGEEVDRSNRTYTLRLRGEAFKSALANGLIYTVNHPVKKPGAYQMRVAVRDSTSARVGSATQFIEVPDVGKSRLLLSGLLLQGTTAEREVKEGPAQTPDPQGHPAVRHFRAGGEIRYAVQVFNARLDPATSRPHLAAQLRLFQNGKKIYEGKPADFQPVDQTDWKRLLVGGRFTLGKQFQPGEYVLQLVVADKVAKPNRLPATQWIDFQVAN